MSDEPTPTGPVGAAPQPTAHQAQAAPALPERNPVVSTLYWMLFIIMAGGLLLSTACTLAVCFDSSGGEMQLGAGAFIFGGPFMLIFGGLAYWFWRLARRQPRA